MVRSFGVRTGAITGGGLLLILDLSEGAVRSGAGTGRSVDGGAVTGGAVSGDAVSGDAVSGDAVSGDALKLRDWSKMTSLLLRTFHMYRPSGSQSQSMSL